MSGPGSFGVEHRGPTLVIVPQRDLGSLAEMEMQSELSSLLHIFANSDMRHVLVDFAHVPYFGSTMISILIKLGKMSRSRGGRMVLCGLSDTAAEVLRVMKLDSLWPMHATREESFEALLEAPAGQQT